MTNPTIGASTRQRWGFVLGRGPSGRGGDVELRLTVTPDVGVAGVVWSAGELSDATAMPRLLGYLDQYLRAHLKIHGNSYGLQVSVESVIIDPERENDYERCAAWAMRKALQELGLPVPPIYAPPDQDPSAP
jgi:hypothetical protein